MQPLLKHRRPGRSGEHPRALIAGRGERCVASGLDHELEHQTRRALHVYRRARARTRRMEYRKLAMEAVIVLDHSGEWREAIKYVCPDLVRQCSSYQGSMYMSGDWAAIQSE